MASDEQPVSPAYMSEATGAAVRSMREAAMMVLQDLWCWGGMMPKCRTTKTYQPCRCVQAADDAVSTALRAAPARFPLTSRGNPMGQTWGHAHGELHRIGDAIVQQATEDRADD